MRLKGRLKEDAMLTYPQERYLKLSQSIRKPHDRSGPLEYGPCEPIRRGVDEDRMPGSTPGPAELQCCRRLLKNRQ